MCSGWTAGRLDAGVGEATGHNVGMQRDIVLASASPSRGRLLDAAGVRYRRQASEVDEEALTEAWADASPADLALGLARAKAEAVASTTQVNPNDLVLGCDSVLAMDGRAHGKPLTAEAATRRWREQRGRTAHLITGHWLIDQSTGAAVGRSVSTAVTFALATDDEIADYVASGEPLGVAGAFTLEGRAGPLIESIDGDPSNVIGLSLPGLRGLLAELGVTMREVTITTERDQREARH